MTPLRLLALAALAVAATLPVAACTDGTTPVCDDAGSCSTGAPPSDAGTVHEAAPVDAPGGS